MCIVLITRCSYLMSTSRISTISHSPLQYRHRSTPVSAACIFMCLSFVPQSSHLIFALPFSFSNPHRHFFYIHFLVLLSALYLPLFAIDTAYAAGWGEETYIGLDVLNGVIVFLQCIFVVGLRSLGTKMIVSSW